MKKSFALFAVLLSLVLALAACGKDKDESAALNTKEVLVGVTGGPHEQVMEKVAEIAKKDGLEIKLKVFNDYNTPNTALADGDLDINSYQTKQFLDAQKADKGYKIGEAFKTLTFPMGIYSKSVKNLDDIKKGDKIAVPNDPSNEYRALKLFEEAGLIKLKEGTGEKATKRDVVENKLNLEILELDSAQLPSQLGEVAAAAINTNFAMGAGLTIKKDAIFHEEAENNPYSNYLVVRNANKNDEVVKKIQEYYQNDEVKQFIEETFNGSIVPSW
ncbi:MAG: MetQ/NlpA family ABC transporter substrate-binding protein [Bacillus sp. (in: firmicutes)]